MSGLNQRRPFTYQQARAAGISQVALQDPTRFQRLLRGVYACANVSPSTALRAEAALLVHPPEAFISHTTSAALQGFPVPPDPLVHLTVPLEELRRRRTGLRTHVRAGATVLTTADGLRLSAGPELFVELAQLLTLLDLVVAGDALVARHGISPRELLDGPGYTVGRSRQGARLVRKGVESPMESRVRLLLRWAGFPEPEVNRVVPHARGTYRLDLCWPDLKLAVEYDGQQHRSDLDQWDSDIQRREWLHRHGWTVVTLVARDVYRRSGQALERVYQDWLDCGGKPFGLRSDWRQHFSVERAA